MICTMGLPIVHLIEAKKSLSELVHRRMLLSNKSTRRLCRKPVAQGKLKIVTGKRSLEKQTQRRYVPHASEGASAECPTTARLVTPR